MWILQLFVNNWIFHRELSSLRLTFMVALLMVITESAEARGARVNIFEQPSRLNLGPGDISNLWFGLGTISFLPGAMRNALKHNSPNRWTRYINSHGQYVIPYIIGGKFDDSELSTIARAMLSIAQNTCVKFQKRAGEADYVELKNERGEGCYTTVGRTSGKNVVMLETNSISTCLEYDIVIHELMHAVGLWHEQMRYDRDNYIKIHYENIPPAYYTQFEKIPDTDSTVYGVKYDYESVMHYAKDAFATEPGKITMETLNKDFQDVIGKMKDASPGDYLKICNIYSCKKCMGRPFTPIHERGDTASTTYLPTATTTVITTSSEANNVINIITNTNMDMESAKLIERLVADKISKQTAVPLLTTVLPPLLPLPLLPTPLLSTASTQLLAPPTATVVAEESIFNRNYVLEARIPVVEPDLLSLKLPQYSSFHPWFFSPPLSKSSPFSLQGFKNK